MALRQVPFGKYFLLERINVGGMAEVYKAKTVGVEGFEKIVAIKRILPAIAEDDDFIKMFIDEAKISVRLSHANVVQTFDLGKINDTYFIAMEYVPSKDLRSIFERLRQRKETLPVELTCYALARVCEGLDYAHRKADTAGAPLNIVHRDVSPQNLLISFEGEVKVIDFGIAKAAGKITQTQAGILKGKFGYMSPEQVRGQSLDRRSDIFAVGIVLYEMLTGERLFTGDSDFSILSKVRAAVVAPPRQLNPNVPPALERICLKALAREVDERYQWGSELARDLNLWLISQPRQFGREELSAFVRRLFPDDYARESKLAANVGSIVANLPKPDTLAGVVARPPEDPAFGRLADTTPQRPSRLGATPVRQQSPPPLREADTTSGDAVASAPNLPTIVKPPRAPADPAFLGDQAATLPRANRTPRATIVANDPAAPEDTTDSTLPRARPDWMKRWWIVPIAIAAALGGFATMKSRGFPLVDGSGKGALVVQIDPADAVLIIDGVEVKSAALKNYRDVVDAEVDHTLEIRRADYQTQVQTLRLRRGEAKTLSFHLARAQTDLALRATPDAEVILDGVTRGQTPLELPVSRSTTHQLRLVRRCFKAYEEVLTPGRTNVEAALEPLPGVCITSDH